MVVPVYNEEDVLPDLFGRLYPALDTLGRSYEIVFVNDGAAAIDPRRCSSMNLSAGPTLRA